MTRSNPVVLSRPSNWALFTITPGPTYASRISLPFSPPPFGAITSRIGSPYFFAKAKSRSSCAGTAMIAPVPYVTST